MGGKKRRDSAKGSKASGESDVSLRSPSMAPRRGSDLRQLTRSFSDTLKDNLRLGAKDERPIIQHCGPSPNHSQLLFDWPGYLPDDDNSSARKPGLVLVNGNLRSYLIDISLKDSLKSPGQESRPNLPKFSEAFRLVTPPDCPSASTWPPSGGIKTFESRHSPALIYSASRSAIPCYQERTDYRVPQSAPNTPSDYYFESSKHQLRQHLNKEPEAPLATHHPIVKSGIYTPAPSPRDLNSAVKGHFESATLDPTNYDIPIKDHCRKSPQSRQLPHLQTGIDVPLGIETPPNSAKSCDLSRRPAIRKRNHPTQNSKGSHLENTTNEHLTSKLRVAYKFADLTPSERVIFWHSVSALKQKNVVEQRAVRLQQSRARKQAIIHQQARQRQAIQNCGPLAPESTSLQQSTRDTMKRGTLQPPAAAGSRFRQINAAKEEQSKIDDLIERTGIRKPPYELLELIGKGSFGRVYKSKSLETNEVVAVKIIHVDKFDYEEIPEAKDDNMSSLIREISVLQQLRDSKARNINVLYEAFSVHSQLWLVTEFCPGGSVFTLMKPFKDGLREDFIVAIAREVAIALKYIHEAGVIHRDVKCANVLITEDGRVQLCDFGIAGVMQNEVSNKRSTIIGTPNWMPPEMFSASEVDPLQYGSEVDIWSFGCTIYEMATAWPPNARVPPQMFNKVLSKPPTIEGDNHSPEIKEFAAFCLRLVPEERPTAEAILQHPFVANSWKSHPTSGLSELLETYAMWESAGNQRMSLFNAQGAQADDMPSRINDDMWNFSTTEDFAQKINHRVSTMFETYGQDPTQLELTHRVSQKPPPRPPGRLTQADLFINEQRIQRGQQAMLGLFDQNAAPYQYGGEISDLPLRNLGSEGVPNRLTMIDLDDAGMAFEDQSQFRLGDPQTVRASRYGPSYLDDYEDEDLGRRQSVKRATMGFSFPAAPPDDKRKTTEWTFPTEDDNDKRATMDFQFPAAEPKRATKDFRFPAAADPRKTMDFQFPIEEEPEYQTQRFSGYPSDSASGFDNGAYGSTQDWEFPVTQSAPMSPNRDSLIDLNAALDHSHRPSTAGSDSKSFTTDKSGNPFDLESEVEIAKRRTNRTSMHTKSQSEPLSHPALPSELAHTALAEQGGDRLSGVSQANFRTQTNSMLSIEERQRKFHLKQITDLAIAYLNEDPNMQRQLLHDGGPGAPYMSPSDFKYLARTRALSTGLPAILEDYINSNEVYTHLDSIVQNTSGAPGNPVFRDPQTGRLVMDLPRPQQVDPEALDHDASEFDLQVAVMKSSAELIDGLNHVRAGLDATEKQKRR